MDTHMLSPSPQNISSLSRTSAPGGDTLVSDSRYTMDMHMLSTSPQNISSLSRTSAPGGDTLVSDSSDTMDMHMLSTSPQNISSLNHTSAPGGDTQDKFASPYLENDVSRMLWLVVPPVLLVLGCYGNVMTLVVMRSMTRAMASMDCLSLYFTALAVSDLLQLCTNFMWYWPEMALQSPVIYFHHLSCIVPFYMVFVTSMTSAWCLVCMTCQRMTSIVVPHRVDALCTERRGKLLIVTIVIGCCLANLSIAFNFRIEYFGEGYPSCVSQDRYVASATAFVYLFLTSVVPFILLLASNSVLIHAVLRSIKLSRKMAAHDDSRKSSRLAKVSSMTTVLVVISITFLLLTLPSSILWMYFELVGYYRGEVEDPLTVQRLALMDTVCALLWMMNSSINFYIYILSGHKFREEAKQALLRCFQLRNSSKLNVLE